MSDMAAVMPESAQTLDRETAGIIRRGIASCLDGLVLLPVGLAILLLAYRGSGEAQSIPLSGMLIPLVLQPAPVFYASIGRQLDLLSTHALGWWLMELAFVLGFAYGTLMLGRYGRTLGMMALRIRATDGRGRDIRLGRAALRTAAYWLPFAAVPILETFRLWIPAAALMGVAAIGLYWIMVDRAHQGYHDKIARTLVMLERCYRERRGPAARSHPRTFLETGGWTGSSSGYTPRCKA